MYISIYCTQPTGQVYVCSIWYLLLLLNLSSVRLSVCHPFIERIHGFSVSTGYMLDIFCITLTIITSMNPI